MTKNNDIRTAAKLANVCLWQIAEKLNMQDSNFSRLLRHELTDEQKKLIIDAIQAIKEGKSDD